MKMLQNKNTQKILRLLNFSKIGILQRKIEIYCKIKCLIRKYSLTRCMIFQKAAVFKKITLMSNLQSQFQFLK